MGYIKDCLIIRSNYDTFSANTNLIAQGLKEKLETVHWSVIDLCGDEATPSNIHYWLREKSRRISKALIYLGHGEKDRFLGQLGGEEITVIDKKNIESMTKYLDVISVAPLTAAEGGIGELAVDCGCHSFFGFQGVEGFSDLENADEKADLKVRLLKKGIWNYIFALAKRESLENCKSAFEEALKSFSESCDDLNELLCGVKLINKYG